MSTYYFSNSEYDDIINEQINNMTLNCNVIEIILPGNNSSFLRLACNL